MMELINLFSKMLGGAATGYITNSLALKMLFRKYGPWGGVILETKDEFIKNAGQLVERDIVNHNTLENELNNSEFRYIFHEIIYDIFNKYLIKNIGEKQWCEIPGFQSTVGNINDILQEKGCKYFNNYQELMDQELEKLTNKIINDDY